MKAIGCISKTEADGKTLCSDCSFADDPAGNDSEGCKDFRKTIGGRLFYNNTQMEQKEKSENKG